MTDSPLPVLVYRGEELARYGFPDGHPFACSRQDRFWVELERLGLDRRVSLRPPRRATRAEIGAFHSPEYVDRVARQSEIGEGFLDDGDTPVSPGLFEAASAVVGSVLDALERLVAGEARRAFVPIAGLHHAHRDAASGFCVFNDIAVAVVTLRARHGLRRLAYVDIDAHHGDGVFHAFEDDPDLWIADIHQDGRFLFPGTGAADERGRGAAAGTKLNLPLLPGAGDREFLAAFREVAHHVEAAEPELILFQCGADGLSGDPLADLSWSARAHEIATSILCAIANRTGRGRLLALGGGGYDPDNIAAAWSTVVARLVDAE